MDIPYEKQFHFGDGSSVGSLEQLKDRIERLSYQEFYRHVNAEKNDFASWIRHVLKDPRLASDLEKVSRIVETVEILNDYLHPRPLLGGGIQSQIETSQGISPPIEIEDVPTTAPREAPAAEGEADLGLIRESIEDDDETGQEDDTAQDGQAQEEFSSGSSPSQSERFVLTAHERRMLVLKDFIFGMLFGLIIGLILGRIISVG